MVDYRIKSKTMLSTLQYLCLQDNGVLNIILFYCHWRVIEDCRKLSALNPQKPHMAGPILPRSGGLPECRRWSMGVREVCHLPVLSLSAFVQGLEAAFSSRPMF
ncbi:hypothetical protein NPIL_603091, partial [Nephila pilipes]